MEICKLAIPPTYAEKLKIWIETQCKVGSIAHIESKILLKTSLF